MGMERWSRRTGLGRSRGENHNLVSRRRAQLYFFGLCKQRSHLTEIFRHTTFCINSLAHWTGLQPYTEEVTAKGNYVSGRDRYLFDD